MNRMHSLFEKLEHADPKRADANRITVGNCTKSILLNIYKALFSTAEENASLAAAKFMLKKGR